MLQIVKPVEYQYSSSSLEKQDKANNIPSYRFSAINNLSLNALIWCNHLKYSMKILLYVAEAAEQAKTTIGTPNKHLLCRDIDNQHLVQKYSLIRSPLGNC